MQTFQIDAEWTDDCSGKKDFDGEIISISTRYWPRGGGFLKVISEPGRPPVIEDNDTRPEIKPSAHSSILLRYKGDDEDGEYMKLADQHFEAETFEEVKAQVERWAQSQMDRLVNVIRKEFDLKPD